MATTLGDGPKSIKDCEGISQFPVYDIDRDPKLSPITLAVCFAVASGYRWGVPKPFSDVIEEKEGKLERRVTWVFDGDSTVEFSGTNIPFTKFWERITEFEQHDPIYALERLSYLLEVSGSADLPSDVLPSLRMEARSEEQPLRNILNEAANIYEEFQASTMPRFLLVREARGKDEIRCYIPLNATEEEKQKLLADAGLS